MMTHGRFRLVLAALLITGLVSCAQINRWRSAHTPPDDGCVHCHYSIYKDWKIAYRPYNEAAKTEDYTPVHSQPMSRADVRMRKSHSEGTGNCSECHVSEKPQESLTISKLGLTFDDTHYQLCGRCHDKTFNEWKRSRFYLEKTPCINCHTSADAPAAAEKGYYHTERGAREFDRQMMRPALMLDRLSRAILVTGEAVAPPGEVSLLLIVTNVGVGHNLPTDALNARLILTAVAIDDAGKPLARKEIEIGGKDYPPLLPGRDTYYEINLSVGERKARSAEISFRHVETGRGKNGEIEVYKEMIPILFP